MSWEEVCHFLAQVAINLDYAKVEKDPEKRAALMTIYPDSKIHKALKAFCDYNVDGFVTYSAVKSVKKEPWE